MSNFSLSVRIPGEWGRHMRTIVITVVIVVAVAYGVDMSVLPFLRV
ncbi:hypothetical protein ACFQVD_37175 [Streptosporangium amethystogenes subsp. fukuiense]|uniref:Uncharacterized protein n=1 Tax=Streptosporangium amethystogenes subsp. fukuiense TaxID=698418 RepID=A0ABW2TCG4_9ACTN